MSDEVKDISALEENISRKGNNSYYYAHGKKIEGPQWDGKEQPRLLQTVVIKPTVPLVDFETFSWLDGTKNVKIYVEFDKANDVIDEEISLNSTETSVEFNVNFNGKTYVLNVNPLNSEIEEASYRKKSDKFIITLKKKVETSWYQLKKKD